MKPISIGDVKAGRGTIVRGRFPLLELPTGGKEFLPIVILQGRKSGPCLWLTANIHGDENTGLVALHRLLTPALVKKLRGTIVAIPALCPANLRARTRISYYVGSDPYTGVNPNRVFPDFRYERRIKNRDPRNVPNVLELAYARLFQRIKETANFLVDLHNSWMGTIPFGMQGRVFYEKPARRKRAESLARKTDAMLRAMGFSIVRGGTPKETLDRASFRTLGGACLNVAGIPAAVLELGTYGFVEEHNLEATREALRNLLVWADMLDGKIEPVRSVPVVDLGHPVVATETPHSPGPGTLDFQVRPGSIVAKGERVAVLRDVWGRTKAEIRAEHDGWIMGTINDVRAYANKPVAITGIRDRTPAALPFPLRRKR
jgi:predicted deacylase